MDSLGKHILIEYYDCNKEYLKDHKYIETIMNKAAQLMGATIVESIFHTFNPWGVSGAVIIAESHLTIHTWPEYNYAAVDLFTCGDIDSWKGFEYLKSELDCNNFETRQLDRGIISNNKIKA